MLALLLSGCASHPPEQPTGVAFAGPATLNLRKDLASKSAVVGSVKHGEKLDVLETRRRFVRVRSEQGVTGWTDSNLLLTPQQMDDLRRLADSAAKLPSQGSATVYEPLNMHADPSRQSPSFFQIPDTGSVQVIGHRVAPRFPAPSAVSPVRRSTSTAKKAKAKDSKRTGPMPDMPKPPPPPRNWEQLSHPRASELPGYAAPAAKPVSLDDWSLVRTKDGKVGWVLSRMLTMSIPDEVAQYAEGHRITAYLPLGAVKDKEKSETKPNWIWTTASAGESYEFDSFRVFVWSLKHHRYETAYIERNVKGYFPVETQDLPGQDEKSFSLVIEDKDGKLTRRTYAFAGFRVKLVSKTPYQPPPPLPEVRASRSFDPLPAPRRRNHVGVRDSTTGSADYSAVSVRFNFPFFKTNLGALAAITLTTERPFSNPRRLGTC